MRPLTSSVRTLSAWLVHAYTALGAGIGFLTILAISEQKSFEALVLMVLAVFVDATDGYLARITDVHHHAPRIDGALLDNIIDFLNYVVTPAYFLANFGMLPANTEIIAGLVIVTVSSYQFTQVDAKTDDHYFKGFPSYWNVAVFYFVIFENLDHLQPGYPAGAGRAGIRPDQVRLPFPASVPQPLPAGGFHLPGLHPDMGGVFSLRPVPAPGDRNGGGGGSRHLPGVLPDDQHLPHTAPFRPVAAERIFQSQLPIPKPPR